MARAKGVAGQLIAVPGVVKAPIRAAKGTPYLIIAQGGVVKMAKFAVMRVAKNERNRFEFTACVLRGVVLQLFYLICGRGWF